MARILRSHFAPTSCTRPGRAIIMQVRSSRYKFGWGFSDRARMLRGGTGRARAASNQETAAQSPHQFAAPGV